MTVEDRIVQGFILAVMFAVGWWGISLIRRVSTSKSEGARRVKLVFWGVAGLGAVALSFNILGPVNTIVLAGIIAVVWWIRRGYRKEP